MWERGDKTNQGIPELNGSSIGIAKVLESEITAIIVNISNVRYIKVENVYQCLDVCVDLCVFTGSSRGHRRTGSFWCPWRAEVSHPCSS